MKKVWCKIKEEILKMLPVFIFFFVTFSLVDISKILLRPYQEQAFNFAVIFMSALVMAKVVLISNIFPIIDHFKTKPLIYSTVWKTFIYFVASILVRLLERILPMLFEDKGFSFIEAKVHEELSSIHFWVAQGWIFVLFLIFVAWEELVVAIGKDKVRKLYFGK